MTWDGTSLFFELVFHQNTWVNDGACLDSRRKNNWGRKRVTLIYIWFASVNAQSTFNFNNPAQILLKVPCQSWFLPLFSMRFMQEKPPRNQPRIVWILRKWVRPSENSAVLHQCDTQMEYLNVNYIIVGPFSSPNNHLAVNGAEQPTPITLKYMWSLGVFTVRPCRLIKPRAHLRNVSRWVCFFY